MRNTFQEFRRDFDKLIDGESFRPHFQGLRATSPDLAVFRTPRDLISHQLSERLVTPDQKDRVLWSLIRAYQGSGSLRLPAVALLFLSMYPVLSRVYRGLKDTCTDEADSAAEVRIEFLHQVSRWNLSKRDRVAANLWMNTRRTILRRRKTEWKEAAAIADATTAAATLLGRDSAGEATASDLWRLSPDGKQPFEPDDLELRKGRVWLARECGISEEDASLLFARYLCHLPWRSISARLGMNPETARKRARDLKQIVRETPGIQDSCPGFGDPMCVPQVEGDGCRTLH